MGKGKGSITRAIVRVAKFRPFMFFQGHYPRSITKVALFFSDRTKIPLGTVVSQNDRLFFGLGNGTHPYQAYSATRLR